MVVEHNRQTIGQIAKYSKILTSVLPQHNIHTICVRHDCKTVYISPQFFCCHTQFSLNSLFYCLRSKSLKSRLGCGSRGHVPSPITCMRLMFPATLLIRNISKVEDKGHHNCSYEIGKRKHGKGVHSLSTHT